VKTAILISGHMRSFERCLPNQAWMVYRHFPDADFFVSTEPDADAGKAELLRERFPRARVSIDATPQPDMAPFIPPGEPWAHAPYAISVSPAAVVGQLWRLWQAWSTVGEKASDYSIVVRIRPDLWFHHVNPRDLRPMPFGLDEALTPWWGTFGGINDRFAVLGPYSARHYFTTFEKMSALVADGCPLHPESLIAASLRAGESLVYPHLDAEFSTLRPDGQLRFPEITAGDIARRMGV
jgi:hypothetical protein